MGLWLGLAHPARIWAQDTAEMPVIVVRGQPAATQGCWDVALFWRRVLHFARLHDAAGTPLATLVGRERALRVELAVLDPQSVELRIAHSDTPPSRRRFQHLPVTCSAQRDAVALALALTLEHALASRAAGDRSATASGEASSASASASPEPQAETPAALGPPQTKPRERTAPTQTTRATATAPNESRPEAAERASTPAAFAPTDAASEGVEQAQAVRAEHGARTLRWGLLVGASGLAGAVPRAVVEGRLGAFITLGNGFGVELNAAQSLARSTRFAGGTVRTELRAGQALGCKSWRLGPSAVQSCVGAAFGVCTAAGRGFPQAYPASHLGWSAALARVAASWPAEANVFLRLAAQGHFNVWRPDIRVSGHGQSLTSGPVGGSVAIDLVLAFH
ncbi:MAG: hypothetical protein RL385_567 [Pseudomonadota bacterium]|jgi:hypothetical protein